MNILIVHDTKIPVDKYGGTERIIWYLGYELKKSGHNITYLGKEGSKCPFAQVKVIDFSKHFNEQIPEDTDIVHFHFQPKEEVNVPYLVSIHGNLPNGTRFFDNTNFVSENHAKRFGADAYVYNGLNWDDYGKPGLSGHENYVHFLGKAAWRVKNVKGAIKLAHRNKTEIKVLGGSRVNFKMGPRITFSKWASFYGMVGGEQKNELLKNSKGLIFPVLWHEPFGLALPESLYFGCPVLGTKYGSLPEIITEEFGYLSNSMEDLASAFPNLDSFSRKICHEYAVDKFNSKVMAENYLRLYEKILNGEKINKNTPEFQPGKNKPELIIK